MDFKSSSVHYQEIDLSTEEYPEEEYKSDSEDYERAYSLDYDQHLERVKKEIDSISFEEIAKYVQSIQYKTQMAEDLVFDKSDKAPEMAQVDRLLKQLHMRSKEIPLDSLIQELYNWMIRRKGIREKSYQGALSSTFSQMADKNSNKSQRTQIKLINLQNKTKTPQKYMIILTQDKGPILTNKGLIPPRQPLPQRFKKITNPKDYKRIEIQVGAKAFCDKGYGIPKLREEIAQFRINMKIDQKRYKAISCGFVTAAWRRMQKYLIEQCKEGLKVASAQQLKCLYTILLNCRDNFVDQEAITFVKFVKLVYELDEVQIFEEETLKLYSKFMIQLQRKLKQCRFNTQLCKFLPQKQTQSIQITSWKPNLKQLWNAENEKEFYTAYLKCKSIAGVRDYFKSKFASPQALKNSELNKRLTKVMVNPQQKSKGKFLTAPLYPQQTFQQHLTDVRILTSKFHKSIRSGLRKIQGYSWQNLGDFPALNRVCDDVIKSMFGSPEAAQVRAAIMEVQRLSTCDKQAVTYAILAINRYNEQKISSIKKRQTRKEANKFDYFKS